MASIKKRPDGVWRARYRDAAGREHARHFGRKTDAQSWLDDETAKLVTGSWTEPKNAKITVGQWCDTWLEGYGTRRPRTVKQAKVHIGRIKAEFASMRLGAVRPSHVKAWTAKLREEGYESSYVHACYRRLAQLMADAVHDHLIARSPCSRRTSPGVAGQRPYVATTEQVWSLHDLLPARWRAAVLLGAFAGLRSGEACGLRVEDVDFIRGVIHPTLTFPAEPLKTETSKTAIPVPQSMALELASHVERFPSDDWLLTEDDGTQLTQQHLERAIKRYRVKVDGLPDGFRFHDLRHYFASLLIDSGASIKVVQTRLRHASATTTLNTYGHLFPDSDESTRAAVDAVFQDRADSLRTREAR